MIDLHLHSTYSDGTNTPVQLIEMALRGGLRGVSITDHDTTDGIGEALEAGEKAGLTVIPGLELSVFYKEYNVHLLGYGFDREERNLQEKLKKIQKSRDERNNTIISRLQKIGIDVKVEELRTFSQCGQTGRPHIARLLMAKKVVKDIDQAFELYLKKGACAYASRYICPADEAIDLIHAASGIAVLAHPVHISSSEPVLERLFREFETLGLDGIETYYPAQQGKTRKRLSTLARKFGFIETGGSDYHGDIRPGTAMAGGHNFSVPDELLEKLQKAILDKYNTLSGL